MSGNGLFSVQEFARLLDITSETLRHYDRIGLLSPEYRGENNYRYYSIRQMDILRIIRLLQNFGMTLSAIKSMLNNRSIEHINAILATRISTLEKEIDKLNTSRNVLKTFHGMINSIVNIDENSIIEEFVPEEKVIFGDINDYSSSKDDYDAFLHFCRAIKLKYPALDLYCPVGGLFSEDRLRLNDWHWPSRYYFYHPEGDSKRPAGLHVIGYMRSGYGKCGELYMRLLDYIDKNGLEICGNGYEDYLINELCLTDNTKYLVRVMIPVRQKTVEQRADSQA
ncbi:MAG: MerR family transcriptional regulator [Deltaproteobacteria bacterium]|nr:MerR family transcriptional regulator [Deltaproteobacteria bacterium]